MASYLSPFNKLIYESVRRHSESQSEISSVDSDWSDIKSIALQLGVANPDDLLTERFKIDRQKLENMIRSECFCMLVYVRLWYSAMCFLSSQPNVPKKERTRRSSFLKV